MSLVKHKGNCHCGAIQWEIQAPSILQLDECNCSICQMQGFQQLTLPLRRFSLTRGQDNLATYTFGTHIAQHYFCKTCGIESYYVPRSNPDGVSINFRCLDKATVTSYEIAPFDGQNWEQNAGKLKGLDK